MIISLCLRVFVSLCLKTKHKIAKVATEPVSMMRKSSENRGQNATRYQLFRTLQRGYKAVHDHYH